MINAKEVHRRMDQAEKKIPETATGKYRHKYHLMPPTGWFAFAMLQLVAVVRIGSEVAADALACALTHLQVAPFDERLQAVGARRGRAGFRRR